MEIRKAKELDVNCIVKINKFVDYQNPDEFIYESVEKWRIYVVLIENKVVGFLLYQLIWGNTPFISLLKIHPNYQKKWYGSSLLWKFEDDLQNEWYNSYYSSTGDDNHWSKLFHVKSWMKEVWRLAMNFWDENYYRKQL